MLVGVGELTGRTLGDRYELERRLGRGGMGEVWAAHDVLIGRRVAIKLLQHQSDDDLRLFFREARTAGGLNHPGVVTVYDLGRDRDGTLYLVMELLAGRDLSAVLRHDGLPAIADAVNWTAQTADALAAAHAAGIVHRDLKPANLMLTPTDTVKILDFGIARYASTVTQASRIIGTPAYMPPERLLGKVGDGRGDLYSLGCLLHQLLTGATPFGDLDTAALMYAHLHRNPDPPSTQRPDIPAALDWLVLDLLAKDPDQRPATAAQVRDRLRTVTTAPPVPPRSKPTAATRPHRPQTPRPAPADQIGTAKASTPGPPAPAQPPLPTTILENPATSDPTRHPEPTRASASNRQRSPEAAHDEPAGAEDRPSSSTPSTLHPSGAPHSAPPRRRALWLGIVIALTATGSIAARAITSTADQTDGGALATPYKPNSASQHSSQAAHLRWAYTTGDAALSSPAVVAGTVYIGSGDGKIYALDAATGTKKWTYTTGGSVYSSPAVDGGTVYVGSWDHKVYALDATTGSRKWAYTTGNAVKGLPAVVDGTVYIGSGDGKIYALDAATGTKKWAYTTRDWVDSSPAVVDGTVYIGSGDGKVYALDAVTGTGKWTYAALGGLSSSPAVVAGTVYIGSVDSQVYALDAATGTKKWTYRTDNRVNSSPVVADGTVYVGSNDGKIYALSAATGTKKWAYTVGVWGTSSPAVVDGTVYTGGFGKVYALHAATGTKKWAYPTGGEDGAPSLAVVDGAVYIGSADGKIYALNAATGTGTAD
ncbi:PQQ-binding-like beta-propeller repeat protein [Streptomyces sp. NPDC057596]|uniref:outer membrane protein assembly factor BamB family protein n=1 Tax=Streptomyces sp. NPDC057596 TaxID=3346178 RepID=UPI0036CA5DCC